AIASGRGPGRGSRRHLAVEALERLADQIIRGEIKLADEADLGVWRKPAEWGEWPESYTAADVARLSVQQLAALTVAEQFADRLPESPRARLREEERGELLKRVA